MSQDRPDNLMDIAYLHAWLRQSLRTRRTEIRTNFSNRLPTAEELNVIILLQRLSDDVKNVSEHVFLLFQMMLLIDRVAINFERVSHTLLQRVGVEFVPRDASDLVRWLMIETLHGERRQQTSAEFSLGHLLSARSAITLASPCPERRLRTG